MDETEQAAPAPAPMSADVVMPPGEPATDNFGERVAVDIHKPKPVHNWREFLSEIGVVVIGVLIALAGEQLVETVHWRLKVSEAREALRDELIALYQDSAERIVDTPCIDAQLEVLKQRVLGSGATLAPAPTTTSIFGPAVIRAPDRNWDDTVWRSVITEQVSSHFDMSERGKYADLYNNVTDMRRINQEETAGIGALVVLASPLPLDPALRGHLVEAIEAERHRADYMSLLARQQMETARMLSPSLDRALHDPAWLGAARKASTTPSFCRAHRFPLAPIPRL